MAAWRPFPRYRKAGVTLDLMSIRGCSYRNPIKAHWANVTRVCIAVGKARADLGTGAYLVLVKPDTVQWGSNVADADVDHLNLI